MIHGDEITVTTKKRPDVEFDLRRGWFEKGLTVLLTFFLPRFRKCPLFWAGAVLCMLRYDGAYIALFCFQCVRVN